MNNGEGTMVRPLTSEERARLTRVVHELGDQRVGAVAHVSRTSVTRTCLNLPRRIATDFAIGAVLPELEAEVEAKQRGR